MKQLLAVSCAGVFLALAGCATRDFATKTMQIQRGDDRAKVLAVFGQPQDRQFVGPTEALQYCGTIAGPGHHSYVAVLLRDGRVTGINTYQRHSLTSTCRGLFKMIKIERRRDQVAESKDR